MPHGDPLNILRGEVLESGANTTTEQLLNTPVNPTSRSVMRIWKVWFEIDTNDTIDPGADLFANDEVRAVLSTRIQITGILPEIDDPGVIAKGSVGLMLWGQAAGAGGSAQQWSEGLAWDYGPGGMLVAVSQVSLYVQGQGQNSAKRARVMVGYTLEVLSPADFFAVVSLSTAFN